MSQNANQPQREPINRYRPLTQGEARALGGGLMRVPTEKEANKGDYVEYAEYRQLAADHAALVQQGIRDHQDWRSKLNFLEADYKAEIARLTAENERLRKAGDANNVRQAECIRKFAELLLEFEFKVEASPNDKILRNICYDARRALNEALHGRFPEGLDGKGYDSGFHQNLILRYKEGRDAK